MAAFEIDREAPRHVLALAPDDAADAGARGHHARGRRLSRRPRAPVKAIAEEMLLAGARLRGRRPERDDVVVGLVVGGQLHELQRAFTPVGLRFDPRARAARGGW